MTKNTAFSPIARTFVILCGAGLWGVLFAFVGSLTQQAWSGAACGIVIGAIIGYSFTKKLIGRVVVWVSVFGILGAVVGPWSDVDACTSAVDGAVIGGLLGWFGWLGVLMLVFGILGLAWGGGVGGESGGVAGMVLGAAFVWFAFYLNDKTTAKEKPENVPPQGEPPVDSRDT